MKSIEELYSNFTEAALLSGKVSRDDITEATKDVPTVEQRLSAVKKLAESKGFKESRPRVQRKNGTFFGETTTAVQDQIVDLMREAGMSYHEANCIATGEVVKANTPNPDFVKESIRKSWLDYLPNLDESDLNTLIANGVWAPRDAKPFDKNRQF